MDRFPALGWRWCEVCMERTMWAQHEDLSWYCTDADHEEMQRRREEWKNDSKADEL